MADFAQAAAPLFTSLPRCQSAAGQMVFMRFSAPLIPLPPEVAKGMTVLPEKSPLSRKVSILLG